MSSSINALFTGTSTYSKDFAQVISRAVQIASLPINQLSSQKDTLTGQQTALSTLSASFSSLQAAVLAINSSAGSGNFAVSYSDNTIASASVSSGAYLGTYNVEVVDPGSQASAASNATVADPTKASISSAKSFDLTANGQTYKGITPPSNTLTGLADAINAATQGAARATIVNVGSTASPQYQLSIQNSSYGGGLPITLNDGSGNLLGTPTAANAVQYRVNGQPVGPATLSAATRTLTIAPNISVTVLKAGKTDITVGQSTSGIAGALGGFVTAYNAARQALDGQRGSSGGALAGQSVINTLSQSLRAITSYGGTGSIQSVSELGLTFDSNGVLSLDASVLASAAAENYKGVVSFLGTPATGGFLQAATNTLNGLTDSTSGVIQTAVSSVTREIADTNNRISQDQARVDQLQQNLNAQMAAADALIAQMQQQVLYMDNLFVAMTANQNTLR